MLKNLLEIFSKVEAGRKYKAEHTCYVCEHLYFRPNEEIGKKINFQEPMDYKDTLNLPKTDFQMKARLSQKEPEMLEGLGRAPAYTRRSSRPGRAGPPYILHDGPPYANGHIHLGHALNKILKDLIIKSRFMTGFTRPPTCPGGTATACR